MLQPHDNLFMDLSVDPEDRDTVLILLSAARNNADMNLEELVIGLFLPAAQLLKDHVCEQGRHLAKAVWSAWADDGAQLISQAAATLQQDRCTIYVLGIFKLGTQRAYEFFCTALDPTKTAKQMSAFCSAVAASRQSAL